MNIITTKDRGIQSYVIIQQRLLWNRRKITRTVKKVELKYVNASWM